MKEPSAAAAAPPANPILGHVRDLLRDPLGFTTLCASYGDAVPLRFGPNRVLMLTNPDDIQDVLVTRNHLFRKSYQIRGLAPLMGNGLLISEGDFWRRQRRLAQPGFHRSRVAEYGQGMVDEVEPLLAGWRDGERRDIHAEMMSLSLEVVAKSLFGADLGDAVEGIRDAVTTALTVLNYRITTLLFVVPLAVPLPVHRRLRAALRRLDDIVYRIIDERRRSQDPRHDVLSMLLEAEDEDGSRMSDRQLRDEVTNLLVAGHETTALALSWSWFLLAQNPAAEARLHDELERTLGGRFPEAADLPSLPYTHAVLREAMRLYPPGWVIFREALQDLEIRGHPVRRGSAVSMPQWVVHRSPRFYPEPERFRPERWLPGSDQPPRFAYFPFGGGPRLCIGSHFAMTEAALVLAAIAQSHRFDLVPDRPVVPEPAITLRPRDGIWVVIRERARAGG